MARIIKLTESDLTRIVKRVLKESTEVPIKVRVFGPFDKQMTKRDCNIEVTNLKVVGSRITFNYKIPGNGWCGLMDRPDRLQDDLPTIGKAEISCGDSTRRDIRFFNGMLNDEEEDTIFGMLSKEGYAKLSAKCDAYVSNDTEMDVDYV